MDEEVHLNKTSSELQEVWVELKDRITELEGVELIVKSNYINWVYLGKNLVNFYSERVTLN